MAFIDTWQDLTGIKSRSVGVISKSWLKLKREADMHWYDREIFDSVAEPMRNSDFQFSL